MPEDASSKKLFYDGDRVYMDINLGNVVFYNSKGAKETYEATKIELHFPAEHYVTINGQTPRYALEVQITHILKKTDNTMVTNSVIKVNKAIMSILFTVGELEEGDVFLNQLGISKYNTDDFDKFLITKPSNSIIRNKVIPATFGVGFNYLAFQGLLNLINSDRKMFYYYGSETTPPCREEVLWMVFGEPRSMSKPQFDYLLLTLAKHKNPESTITDARTPNKLYGNKRALVLYDETLRGKILANPIGLRHVTKRTFFNIMN